MLSASYCVPSAIELPAGVSLSKHQNRFLNALYARQDQLVTKQQLMDALYFDHAGDEPGEKILDVYCCHLRKKIASLPWKILTIFGQGYKLVEHREPV